MTLYEKHLENIVGKRENAFNWISLFSFIFFCLSHIKF